MNVNKLLKTSLEKIGLLETARRFHYTTRRVKVDFEGVEYEFIGYGGDFFQSILLYGCYEPGFKRKAIEHFKGKKNLTLLDIGCGEGDFSAFLYNLNKDTKIIGFDCDPLRCETFLKNNTISMDDKAVLIDKAVGTGEGMINLDNYFGGLHLKKEDILIIKIDVEGAEYDVLKTCKNLKKRPNTYWFIEVHPKKIIELDQSGFFYFQLFTLGVSKEFEWVENHRGQHRLGREIWDSDKSSFSTYCNKLIEENNGHNLGIILLK